MCAPVHLWRIPTILALLAILSILAASMAGGQITAVLPPTLSQIEDAITDSSANWTAGTNPVWNQSWSLRLRRLGCLQSKGEDPGSPLPPLRDIKLLPASLGRNQAPRDRPLRHDGKPTRDPAGADHRGLANGLRARSK